MGLLGKANTNKALAPKEAMSHSSIPLSLPKNLAKLRTSNKPIGEPTHALRRSAQLTEVDLLPNKRSSG
jgi:hypothetical protein